ncbi:dihydroorotate dehydrogenase electron transfer subunit [Nitratidesulfovibrio vulgaris]|nr:dihydroorotate dehydrogenase electron transfer subunit [Nitratidesulfovibrio vulgaris]
MHTSAFTELKVLDLVPFGLTSGEARFYALRLERPDWGTWAPGQFVMLRPAGWALDMLWARPFSICRVSRRDLVIFFQVVGRGTRRLAELHAGDTVHVWGPLGNSFAVEPDTPTLLLAGGIGIAPFIGYVHEHPKPWNVWMDFGHRMPLGCYPFDSISDRIMADTHMEECPEDLQKFIDLLGSRMAEFAEKQGLVLACGPTPFLKTVRDLALHHGVRTQLSLETRMACGVGACLGCVCRTTEKWPDPAKAEGRVQTCTSGPIFWADQITFDEA